MKSGVTTKQDRLQALVANVKKVTGQVVLVGIPGDNNDRQSDELSNSDLGYIHEFGAPEANIPARPMLVPGVRSARSGINAQLAKGAKAQITTRSQPGNQAAKHLMAAGQIAVSSIQARIRSGIAPPLSSRTLAARARRKKGSGHRISQGAIQELRSRSAGNAAGVAYAKPLIDTGQLLKSFTYVLRKR